MAPTRPANPRLWRRSATCFTACGARNSPFCVPKDLRLGATVRGRNGQILQFARRRGDKNTLLDASGAALPDDALAPFLGAATREIFHRAFGLEFRVAARGRRRHAAR